MRRGNIDSAIIKLLLTAAGIILTCIVITIGIMSLNRSREMANITAGKMNEFTKELLQSDILTYDGLSVRGSDVINFYKRHFSDVKAGSSGEFSLIVITAQGENIYTDGSYLSRIRDISDSCYIKPTAKFNGMVKSNENGIIVSVTFTQE